MDAHYLLAFGVSYSAVTSVFLMTLVWRRRSIAAAAMLVLALAAQAVLLHFGVKVYENPNPLLGMLRSFGGGMTLSALLGAASAVPWGVAAIYAFQPLEPGSRRWKRAGQVLLFGILTGCLAFHGAATYVFADRYLAVQVVGQAKAIDARLQIEAIADLEVPPVCIASDDAERLFVSFNLARDDGYQTAGVLEVVPQTSGEPAFVRSVAESVALFHPYGLAFHDGDLYISRAGTLSTIKNGQIQYADAGAVTRARDLDGDGYFEHLHDVVTGLPGIRGTINQHQNCGLLVKKDGSLVVGVGNAGDRTPTTHPWEGTILSVDNTFSQVEVLARGIRNPFGLCLGPDDALFSTDQDWSNSGDEINLILPGRHYGHPFVVGKDDERAAGFEEPLYTGSLFEVLCGLTYLDSEHLPPDIRGSLLVCDFGSDQLALFKVIQAEDGIRLGPRKVLAEIKRPVDVVQNSDGTIYVISRNQKVYRLRFDEAAITERLAL